MARLHQRRVAVPVLLIQADPRISAQLSDEFHPVVPGRDHQGHVPVILLPYLSGVIGVPAAHVGVGSALMEQKSEHLEIPVLDGVGQGRKVVFPAVPPVHVRSVPYQPPDFLFPLVQGLIPVPYHGDDQGVALRQIGVDVLPVRNRHPRHALHILIGIRVVGVDFLKALDVHQVLFRDHVFLKVQGLDCGMSAQPRRESRVIGDDVHLAVELFGGLFRHLYNLSVRIAGPAFPLAARAVTCDHIGIGAGSDTP